MLYAGYKLYITMISDHNEEALLLSVPPGFAQAAILNQDKGREINCLAINYLTERSRGLDQNRFV